jgi:anti-anti-sigma factor
MTATAVRPHTRTVSLALAGDPSRCCAALTAELERLAGTPTRLVVDLDTADAVDSTVLGALVLALKRLQASGGELAVACRRPETLRLLRLTGLDRVLAVV